MTLAEIREALRCALPVLPAEITATSARASCFAARHLGRVFVIGVGLEGTPRVPLSSTARALLPLCSLRAADGIALYQTDAQDGLFTADLDELRAPSGKKLVLRGFPTELTRVDNDDGTLRWRSVTLTAQLTGEGALVLDEPDAIRSFDGLQGAPIFSLPQAGLPSFAGILLGGEKQSVLGRGSFLPAAALRARLP